MQEMDCERATSTYVFCFFRFSMVYDEVLGAIQHNETHELYHRYLQIIQIMHPEHVNCENYQFIIEVIKLTGSHFNPILISFPDLTKRILHKVVT